MSPLIDIGANLGHESFAHDLDQVLERAAAAGIVALLVTGTSVQASEQALQLSDRYPHLFATAGIHPHEARHYSPEALSQLRALLNRPKVLAVGEMGLDFNRDYSPRPDQEKAFSEQLQLAADCGKPVFLHQRDAHSRFHPMLKELRDALKGGVVHCFTGTKAELFAYLDMDMYIGITGWVCDERRGAELQSLVKHIPAERLLLETDAPYLLPRTIRPKPRSRRNEPCHLTEVLQTVARLREEPVAQLAQQSTDNARRLFNLPG